MAIGKKKTHEQFINEVYGLVDDEYNVIGKYVTSGTKLEILHLTCNKKYEVTPSNFLRGDRCPHCNGNKKRTHQDFLNIIDELVGNEYEILSNYKNSNSNVKMRHTVCNHEYEVTPAKFIKRGQRCPNCNKFKQFTSDDFLNKLIEEGNHDYIHVGDFINMNTKTIIKHKECGYNREISPTHFFKSKNKCLHCSGNIRKKTTSIFKKEVYDRVEDEYSVIEDYVPQNKILMRHNTCGHEWKVYPSSFLSGSRCPKCNGGVRKTTEQFKIEVYNLVEKEYEVLGEYKNNITRITLLHNKCRQTSMICPIDFLEGVRCLHCNSSRGEKRIYTHLTNNGYLFEEQYKFKDCKKKRPLPFDFIVFNDDNTIKCLIEYDGIQHFETVEIFGGQKGYLSTIQNDSIKNEYCKLKGIHLIRIPYWDFENIEEILNSELV